MYTVEINLPGVVHWVMMAELISRFRCIFFIQVGKAAGGRWKSLSESVSYCAFVCRSFSRSCTWGVCLNVPTMFDWLIRCWWTCWYCACRSWCTSFARALLFATDAVSGTMTLSHTTCKLVDGLVSSGLIPARGSVLFSLSTKGTFFSHGWMGLHQFSISLGVSMLLMLVLMPCFLSCHVLILTGSISSHDCLLAYSITCTAKTCYPTPWCYIICKYSWTSAPMMLH